MRNITPHSLEILRSRVSYARDFVSFTKEDAAALHAAKPYLAPLVPSVVDAVYTKLFEFSITAESFIPRQTGYTGEAPTSLSELTLDHPQIRFRKDFLTGYIVKLVTMDYSDFGSWEYLDKVGRVHTDVKDSGFKHRAKKPGLRVDYVHCALLLGSLFLSRRWRTQTQCSCQVSWKIFLFLLSWNTLKSTKIRNLLWCGRSTRLEIFS